MKPEEVVRNRETNEVEKVIFLYRNRIRISFILQDNKVKKSSFIYLSGGLMNGDGEKIPSSVYRDYVRISYGIFRGKNESKIVKYKKQHVQVIKRNISNKQEIAWADSIFKRSMLFSPSGEIMIINKKDETGMSVHYKDLFSAIRGQSHILEKYIGDYAFAMGEIGKIDELQVLVSEFNSLLLSSQKDDVPNEKLIREKSELLVSELIRCRDKFKVDARDSLSMTANTQDSLGRKNLPSKAARTVRALNNLSKRVRAIISIIPWIITRKNLLNNYRLFNNQRLSEVRKILTQIRRADFENQKREIDTNLGMIIHILSWRFIEPYKSLSEGMIQEIIFLKDCLRNNKQRDFFAKFNLTLNNLNNFLNSKQNI